MKINIGNFLTNYLSTLQLEHYKIAKTLLIAIAKYCYSPKKNGRLTAQCSRMNLNKILFPGPFSNSPHSYIMGTI